MARIEKRSLADGTPRYKCIIRRKGAPLKTKTFRTRSLAKKWATRIEAEILDGRALPTREQERRTIADLVGRYEEEVLPAYGEHAQRRRTAHLDWWCDRLGEMPLIKVTRSVVDSALRALATGQTPTGRPAAPATRNRYLATLCHAFSVAKKRWEWIDRNPLTGLAPDAGLQ